MDGDRHPTTPVGPEVLHAAHGEARKALIRLCASCHEPIDRNAPAPTLYCSPICRAAGSRRRARLKRPDTIFVAMEYVRYATFETARGIEGGMGFVLVGTVAAGSHRTAIRRFRAQALAHRGRKFGLLVLLPLRVLKPSA